MGEGNSFSVAGATRREHHECSIGWVCKVIDGSCPGGALALEIFDSANIEAFKLGKLRDKVATSKIDRPFKEFIDMGDVFDAQLL